MIAAHDIYAETNPAFCAAVLADFCQAHYALDEQAAAMIVVYAVLPIALSEDLAATFHGTNKSTGLLVWLHRSPKVLTGLAERVNATLPVTTDAIRFGCMAQLLQLNRDGSLSSMNKKLPKASVHGSPDLAFKRARMLGSWFAGTGSARAVMEALGVSV